MTAPTAPLTPVLTSRPGIAELSWATPASPGTSPIVAYRADFATDAGFTAIVSTVFVSATSRAASAQGVTPGATIYARVYADNGALSPASTTASAVIATRTALDAVQGASISLPDGTQVELRGDGANAPTVTLGYIPIGSSTFTAIATVPVSGANDSLTAQGGPRNLALVADPAGNLYVIGNKFTTTYSALKVRKYTRSGPTAWAFSSAKEQLVQTDGSGYSAAYVPGVGLAPTPSIVVVYRRLGDTDRHRGAIIDVVNFDTPGADLLLTSSSTAWMPIAPVTGPQNTGIVSVATVPGTNRVIILASGYAVVDVVNGVPSSVYRSSGVNIPGPWGRVVPISSTMFAALSVVAGALSCRFYAVTGELLGTFTIPGADSLGGAFIGQWDAYYDRVARLVRIYYVADTAGARTLERVDVSSDTFLAGAATTLTAALGAAASTNSALRVPGGGAVDERRVIVAAANVLAGVKSVAIYSDTAGNVAPLAPVIPDVVLFDAASSYRLPWTFTDSNPYDTQTAYELEVQRVSDSVNVVATGKVVTPNQYRDIAAATLVNGVNYRWRVRTWDKLDTVGAWTSYDPFTTASVGSLTITSPAADDPAGLDVSTIAVAWNYSQADGYVQAERRIKVLNAATLAVISDTGVQVSNYPFINVSVPTGVRVRIEVTVTNDAPVPASVTAVRFLTSNYELPMPPDVTFSLGEAQVNIHITNPAPSGSRPVTVANTIERREATGVGLGGTAREWVPFTWGPVDNVYPDCAVKSGRIYEYRVKASAASGAFMYSDPQFAPVLNLPGGAWLFSTIDGDPRETMIYYPHTESRPSEGATVDSAVMAVAGRRDPLIEYGENESASIELAIFVPFDERVAGEVIPDPYSGLNYHDYQKAWWESALSDRRVICYRDNRGRLQWSLIAPGGLKIVDGPAGTGIGVTLLRVDYDETNEAPV